MLYIFGGLPAAGKSTLARALAHERGAVYVRVDTIEQALRANGAWRDGPEGYAVGYQVAADNLALGLAVVADSVNPLTITRQAWRDLALRAGVPLREIEVICSDTAEHRVRAETRVVDIAGLVPPTWDAIVRRSYAPWEDAHLVIDTAGQTTAQSIAALLALLQEQDRQQ